MDKLFWNPAMIAIIMFSTYKFTYNPSSGHEGFAMSSENDCKIFSVTSQMGELEKPFLRKQITTKKC